MMMVLCCSYNKILLFLWLLFLGAFISGAVVQAVDDEDDNNNNITININNEGAVEDYYPPWCGPIIGMPGVFPRGPFIDQVRTFARPSQEVEQQEIGERQFYNNNHLWVNIVWYSFKLESSQRTSRRAHNVIAIC